MVAAPAGSATVLMVAVCGRFWIAARPAEPASIRFRAMGVLDDAIREHLELKRKHGAPEEELRRQEEEALGPVRREVAPPDEVEGDGEPAAEATEPPAEPVAEPGEPAEPVAEPVEPAPVDAETSLLAEPEPEPFAEEEAAAVPQAAELAEPEPFPEDEAAAVPQAAELAEPEPEPFPEEEAAAVPQAAGPVEPLPDPEESEDDEEAVFDPPDEGALGGDPRTVPTVDEDGDGADSEHESDSAGNVLEDTPDFLEETPEHDRLWFEQKPPRDFDFD
jgi:hypothetical protein